MLENKLNLTTENNHFILFPNYVLLYHKLYKNVMLKSDIYIYFASV